MSTKLALSRVTTAAVALAVTLGGGCATSNTAASAGSSASGERDTVVRCYANGYRKRSGVGPVLDDKTDAAADQFLKKYDGNAKRACDVITTALASNCAGSTLDAVIKCDQRQHGPVIDPATKAQLETQVREHDQQQAVPGQRGY